jgi:hypothetical protein
MRHTVALAVVRQEAPGVAHPRAGAVKVATLLALLVGLLATRHTQLLLGTARQGCQALWTLPHVHALQTGVAAGRGAIGAGLSGSPSIAEKALRVARADFFFQHRTLMLSLTALAMEHLIA